MNKKFAMVLAGALALSACGADTKEVNNTTVIENAGGSFSPSEPGKKPNKPELRDPNEGHN